MARLEQIAPDRHAHASATGGLCTRRERMVKQLILANLGESLEVTELAPRLRPVPQPLLSRL